MLQGDLIPWTVGQQFQDSEFPLLSGARIVRIAVHPDLARAGYGTRTVQLLRRYYQGELAALDADEAEDAAEARLRAERADSHPAVPSTTGPSCLLLQQPEMQHCRFHLSYGSVSCFSMTTACDGTQWPRVSVSQANLQEDSVPYLACVSQSNVPASGIGQVNLCMQFEVMIGCCCGSRRPAH